LIWFWRQKRQKMQKRGRNRLTMKRMRQEARTMPVKGLRKSRRN
jgi:hypothetical protein